MRVVQINTGKWRMVTGCGEVVRNPMEEPKQRRHRKTIWEKEERRCTELEEERKRELFGLLLLMFKQQ